MPTKTATKKPPNGRVPRVPATRLPTPEVTGQLQIAVSIGGISPLLCHRFTDEAAAGASAGTSAVIKSTKNQTPRQMAEPFLYTDADGRCIFPGQNVFVAIMDAGKFHKVGKTKLTTQKSSLVPAGLALLETELLLDPQKWEVDERPIRNPSTGGRRLCWRPRFEKWALKFTLDVDTGMFHPDLIRTLVDDAGKKLGIGSFRPACKGQFGRFVVTSWKLEK